jgi:hypothetical protein
MAASGESQLATNTYASRHGHTLIDRRVYLPESWTSDRERLDQAGVPDDITFATRSRLADDIITAAVAAQVPATWAVTDEAYGNTKLRFQLRKHGLGYVLAVSRDHLLPLDAGKTCRRADLVADDLKSGGLRQRRQRPTASASSIEFRRSRSGQGCLPAGITAEAARGSLSLGLPHRTGPSTTPVPLRMRVFLPSLLHMHRRRPFLPRSAHQNRTVPPGQGR